jgi:hypothetical protein
MFAANQSARDLAQLMDVITVAKLDHNKLDESFRSWENKLIKYERDSKTQLPDNLKMGLLINKLTCKLRDHVRLNISTITTYQQLRELVFTYFKTNEFDQALS